MSTLNSYTPPHSIIDNFVFPFMFAEPTEVFEFQALGVLVKENWNGDAEIWVKTENKSTVHITDFPLGAVCIACERPA